MAKYPGTLESNNPKEFGIVYATEVAGHKTVLSLEELNTLSNAILSKSKTNLNNDAIGLIWFVIDQNKYYLLISWEPKTWEEFEAGVTNELFTNTLNSLKTEITNNLNTKVDKEEGKGLSSNDYIDEEKSKLEGIEAGALVNKINSVAGKIGDVVLNKTDVGLSNVDNTADLDKPISTATQDALDTKADIDDLSNVLSEEVIGNPLLEEINTLTREEIKKDLFIDMWNKAVGSYGTYNAETDYFELNGLTDITYEEAIGVYASYPLCKHLFTDRRSMFSGIKDRTLLPIRTNSFEVTGYIEAFLSCPNLVAVKFITAGNNPIVSISNGQNMFLNCPSLKYIYDTLVFGSNANLSGTFESCPSLEKVRIKNLMKSLSMAHSPKLSLDSISYMVTNAANALPITITVHSDVYSKLTDESNTEWHALIEQAAEKNIMFITTS